MSDIKFSTILIVFESKTWSFVARSFWYVEWEKIPYGMYLELGGLGGRADVDRARQNTVPTTINSMLAAWNRFNAFLFAFQPTIFRRPL